MIAQILAMVLIRLKEVKETCLTEGRTERVVARYSVAEQRRRHRGEPSFLGKEADFQKKEEPVPKFCDPLGRSQSLLSLY